MEGSEKNGAVGVESESERLWFHSLALENGDERLHGDGGRANVKFDDFVERCAQRVFHGVCKHEQVEEDRNEDTDRGDHGDERQRVREESRESGNGLFDRDRTGNRRVEGEGGVEGLVDEVEEEGKEKRVNGTIHDCWLFLEEKVDHVDTRGENEGIALLVADESGHLSSDVGIVNGGVESGWTCCDSSSNLGDCLDDDDGEMVR